MSTQVYKLCTILSLALALTLSVTGIYTVWKFSTHEEGDWNLTHVELTPTMEYFDANRK